MSKNGNLFMYKKGKITMYKMYMKNKKKGEQ